MLGKRLTQRRFLQGLFIILIILRILFAVTLALLFGKRLTQRRFLQGFFILLMAFRGLQRLIVAGTLFLLGYALRRQLDAVRSQLAPGRNTHRIRPRQFRADALFHLRVAVAGGRKGRHKGIGGNGTDSSRSSGFRLRFHAAKWRHVRFSGTETRRRANVNAVALSRREIKRRAIARLRYGRCVPIAQTGFVIVPVRIGLARHFRRRRLFRNFKRIQRWRRVFRRSAHRMLVHRGWSRRRCRYRRSRHRSRYRRWSRRCRRADGRRRDRCRIGIVVSPQAVEQRIVSLVCRCFGGIRYRRCREQHVVFRRVGRGRRGSYSNRSSLPCLLRFIIDVAIVIVVITFITT
ncbi:hypothetical protein D3C79_664150 [compost metagenome]